MEKLLIEYEQPRRKWKFICEMTEQEYISLKSTGMFWEWYPEATGIYEQDKILSKNKNFLFEQRS